MMSRERLRAERSVVNKMDYHARTDLVRALIDSHIKAWDEIERLEKLAPRDC